jgi:hypothetical protein
MSDNLFGDDSTDYDNPSGLTKLTRERPNGRLVGDEPDRTGLGVDRNNSGRFASRDRSPVPVLRDEDGTFESDPYAAGNFGTFDGDEWDSSGGKRR